MHAVIYAMHAWSPTFGTHWPRNRDTGLLQRMCVNVHYKSLLVVKYLVVQRLVRGSTGIGLARLGYIRL